MNAPIICSGNYLARVLSDIRSKGGVITAMDAGFGGNAQYRVSYFGRCAPTDGESSEVPGCKTSGVTIAAKPTIGKHGQGAAAGSAGIKPKSVTDAPASISLPPQPRTDLSREGRPKSEDAALGAAISIEERMAPLYAKVVGSGKVRSRFKSSTKSEHARTPYREE